MKKNPTYEELEERIQELERIEFKYKQAEEQHRIFSDNAIDAFYLSDMKGRFLDANKAACAMLGYTHEEMLAMTISDVDTNFPSNKLSQILGSLHSNEPRFVESSHKKKNGEIFPVDVWIRSFGSKEQPLLVSFARDVTERKQIEESLRQEKEFAENLINTAQAIVLVLDPDGRILSFNPYMEKISGYKLAHVKGKDWFSLFLPGQDHDNMRELFKRAVSDIQTHGNVNPIIARDGREILIEWNDKTLKDKDGKIVGILAIGNDITEHKLAEEVIRESEQRFKTVADFTYDWENWVAPDGSHLYVSPSCKRITGYTPDDFMNNSELMMEIIHPDDKAVFTGHKHKANVSGDILPIDFRILTKGGDERWISHICQTVYSADGSPLGLRGSNRDITENKKLQEELIKARKIESIGTLAGGIAHDFNNLLYVVVGNISLAQDDLNLEIETSENLKEAEKACIKAKKLTAQLITFSKGGDPVRKINSIDDLLKNIVTATLSGSDIKPAIFIADDIRQVNIDESQIKQVVHNIVANAREAMEDKGQLKVSCENLDITEEGYLTLTQGAYIKISFTDQGCGILKENFERIFDPYFSTKEMGIDKGQGLGLTVSYSIVQKHGGLINVKSELGTGSTFSIYLQAFLAKEPDLQKSKRKPTVQKPVKQPATGTKKILLMDDEKAIRTFLGKAITRLGYYVETCIEGKEAIEIYTKAMESKEPFDVVILDLTNKIGMGGQETMQRLLELDSDVKGIIITGYSDDPAVANFRAYGFSGFIAKPATKGELSRVISEVISRN
ncbi:MAG: PAS domain S-box protein [Bacteroidetes bacterium]|nr:PAS domain S-box protein [Bacteroidota bacterium]